MKKSHYTGGGGISLSHRTHRGDLVWNIGTVVLAVTLGQPVPCLMKSMHEVYFRDS